MGLRQKLNDNVFKGNDCYNMIWGSTTTAVPSAGSHANVPAGGLVYDSTNDNWYICTAAGATFVKINA